MKNNHKIIEDYEKKNKKVYLLTAVLLVLILISAFHSLISGAADIDIGELIRAVIQKEGMIYNIIWNIRLPRILTAVLAGMGLAVSGAVMQSILKNPLGSPFTLGISHAAAFGAAFAIIILDLGGSLVDQVLGNVYIPAISAFVFSQIAIFIVIFLARKKSSSPETMVLAGIALSSLFTAGTTVLQFFADDLELASVVYWTFGDPGRASWTQILIIALAFFLIFLYFIYQAWNYSILNAGDELAVSLGINTEKIRLYGMFSASLLTAIIISFVGIIGFIGLVTPHIIRKISKSSERFHLINSALAGGLLLILADNLSRTLFAPVILPVGVLTSFLGAPLFIYLVVKGRQYW
ncbi:MAG: FecCD family ABC transporter permease [Bacillota bacterium]